ncbi:MAG: histidine kinase N-terminal 7TM domain-containing protein [Bacillota bacterium]|nr:histidine kinase N-terminal 7TM domain-containing protein [Bacillota bacterium]
MFWKFAFNQDLWPALISVALTTILGLYSWRRRNVPGARTFAIGCLFATLWVMGVCVEIAAVVFSAKVFWLKFNSLWHLPAVTTLSCFFIQYAGLGRYLTRRNLIALFLPSALAFLLISTDHYHHLFWTSLTPGDHVIEVVGIGTWISIGFVNLLGIVNIAVLLWLAIGSKRYRWPVVLMLAGQFSGRVMYALDITYIQIFSPGVSALLIIGLSFILYALALFNFHVFDPIPMVIV